MSVLIFSVFAWAGSPIATQGVKVPNESNSFGKILNARFDQLNVPGLGYAVVVDGKIFETGGIGVSDARSREPVTAATPFRIASLTKPMSAALLLTAVEKGKLDLDTPLVQASARYRDKCEYLREYTRQKGWTSYFKGIECGDERVTLRSAATHTSRRPVGSKYSYNGMLFGMLSEPIVEASQLWGSLESVFRARIIEPPNLRHSAAGPGDQMAYGVVANYAPPHRRAKDGNWRVGTRSKNRINAAAGFIASAHDLAQIDIRMTPGELVTREVWAKMTTPTVLTNGENSPYGIGWFVQELRKRRIVWHYGLQPNSHSGLWIKDLEKSTSLILLANSDDLTRRFSLGRGDAARAPVLRWFLDWTAHRLGE